MGRLVSPDLPVPRLQLAYLLQGFQVFRTRAILLRRLAPAALIARVGLLTLVDSGFSPGTLGAASTACTTGAGVNA